MFSNHEEHNLKQLLNPIYNIMRLILPVIGLALASAAFGASFDDALQDRTLRLDYIFSGSTDGSIPTSISIADMEWSDGWFGRRGNLNKLPLLGNGQVTMTSLNGDTIYATSFSSLFCEWLTTDDSSPRAFQHTVLLPMPQESALVTLTLTDARHQVTANHKLTIAPDDYMIRHISTQPATEPRWLHRGDDPRRAIDIAILAEGYRPEEMDSFYRKAQLTVDEMLSYQPYARYADRINFVAVATPSHQSGVSVPHDSIWVDTPFGAHFDTFGAQRYMTSDRIFAMHDALRGVPYEHIIILANTDTYGGAGIFNDYILAAAENEHFRPVVVHEFAHSFGGLADEYFYENDIMSEAYPPDIEPWEQNITTMADFKSKWEDMLPKGTPVPTPVKDADRYPVGVYEGGGYSFHGVYRPADQCRMRNNTWPTFCPVCERSLARLIEFYTDR